MHYWHPKGGEPWHNAPPLNTPLILAQKFKSCYQRWSREHKARGQGHQKNPRPRPRTAFSKTDPLEAKDRNARGQGQGSRTQPQVFSKKNEGLQKSFSGNLQLIGGSRIFDLRGPKPQITCNDVFKNFPKKNLFWGKNIIEWKI